MTAELFREVNDRIRELGSAALDEFDFVCECGGEGCTHGLRLTRQEYDAVRANPEQFVLLPGHELGLGEILHCTDRYVLVRKDAALIAG
jgi:hypothetical protein